MQMSPARAAQRPPHLEAAREVKMNSQLLLVQLDSLISAISGAAAARESKGFGGRRGWLRSSGRAISKALLGSPGPAGSGVPQGAGNASFSFPAAAAPEPLELLLPPREGRGLRMGNASPWERSGLNPPGALRKAFDSSSPR